VPNRLALETSPYLLQHAQNPVDWYPWGVEAFEVAAARQCPVFLSVGYSSCHWCHVMEHESFEHADVARVLNERFVSVKVDREEMPDVDDTYMTFVQMYGGRGGWPMSVFMTPEMKPFFGGTYWPRQDRGGHPGFLRICNAISEAWENDRDGLEKAAEQYADALKGVGQRLAPPAGITTLDESFVNRTIEHLHQEFDAEFGGFGGAPKFPPHSSLELLLRTRKGMALETLLKMALGGIHDHVGGGFHRYSTDERWHLPHFEKMLYDNALLLGVYSSASERDDDIYFRAAAGIVEWFEREMLSPDGLLYSAIDADSEGEEGRFYLWKRSDLPEELADLCGALPEGNFFDEASGRKNGLNVLHLVEDDGGAHRESFEQLRLLRDARPRPMTDTKAIVAWNGIAISSLVHFGRQDLAERIANVLLAAESTSGQLPRQITNGKAKGTGYLEDYAWFALGLFELGGIYTSEAERLGEEMVRRFYDPELGGFFSSEEVTFSRTKLVFDQPIPSANSVAIRVLLRMGELGKATKSIRSLAGWVQRAPHGTEGLALAALELFEMAGEIDLSLVGFEYREGVLKGSIAGGYHIDSGGLALLNGSDEVWTYEGAALTGAFELPIGHVEADVAVYQICSGTECMPPQEISLVAHGGA